MSYNLATDANLVSPRLVSEVLRLTIHLFDKESRRDTEQYNGQDVEVQGYVDLVWCFHSSRKIFEPTRFLVTAAYDPPFDVVLGRKDCRRAGIA